MFELKMHRGVFLMALNIGVKFAGKLTEAFKNDMMFERLKIATFIGLLYPKCRKSISLKFLGELCVKTMKNDARFEEELTCHFKINMRNLTNFDPSTQKTE